MKSFFRWRILFLPVLLFFSIGCATNRGVVSLKQSVTTVPVQSSGKKVFIKSVTDQREFQENPATQDIPSLGFGGATAATAEIKKRAIARKRNAWGKAMGDILLENGQTVESVISDSLKRSFGELGYVVLSNEQEVTSDTLVMDASIQKFWAYMTPGFWAISLSCDISTTLRITVPKSNTGETETITVKSTKNFQTASEGNWMEVFHLAMEKYVEQVKTRFSRRE
ncbi:MAG: hypothetical protein FP816_01890 [Desulfobacteraceae bacterium]|nr:hypothetical protein [Desulfobacteraceae bacterium]